MEKKGLTQLEDGEKEGLGTGGVGVLGYWGVWWSRSHLHINYQAGAGGRF